MRLTRRRALAIAAYGAAGICAGPLAASDKLGTCTLGFSTYGMKEMPTEEAILAVAEIGYDAIEITVWPDWDAAPANMSAERRLAVRGMLSDSNLTLTSLMEHIEPSSEDPVHAQHRQRLSRAFELGHDLAPQKSPLVQTVLGGREWSQKRNLLRDRLGDWLLEAERAGSVLAIKPHRGGAMSRPEEAKWLIDQLGGAPRLRMVYDYSHYAFRGMPLEETIAAALPITAHVAVKDAVQRGGKVSFELPGAAGTIDYAELLRRFYEGGYRGDISCEVSSAVWRRAGYQPLPAAQRCYAAISEAFRAAEVPRPVA